MLLEERVQLPSLAGKGTAREVMDASTAPSSPPGWEVSQKEALTGPLKCKHLFYVLPLQRTQASPLVNYNLLRESEQHEEERAGLRRPSSLEQGTQRPERPSTKSLTCCWFHLRSGMRTKPSEGSGFSKTIRSASAFLSRILYTHWKEGERGGSQTSHFP